MLVRSLQTVIGNVDDQSQYRQIMTQPAWLRDRQVAECQRSVAAYLGWCPGPSLARSRTQLLAPWSRSSDTSRGIIITMTRPLLRPLLRAAQSVFGSLVSLPATWGCTCCLLSHWFLTVTGHFLHNFLDITSVWAHCLHRRSLCCLHVLIWSILWYVMRSESLPVLCLAWYWLTSGEPGPAPLTGPDTAR